MAAASGATLKMAEFAGTCTPEQLAAFKQVLDALQEKHDAEGAANAASTMAVKAGVAAKKAGKKAQKKKAKIEGTTGGPKRPLNSWMAYRKYYNGSLAPNTQKSISKVLTVMWRADPFEGKWAVLAKAYSVLRGSREKEDAPLDKFLEECAPLIGVIPPDRYQEMMGWQLNPAKEDDKERVPVLVRLFVPAFAPETMSTSLSVDDLVKHCYAVGFVKNGVEETAKHTTSGSLTMAVQPTNTSVEEASHLVEAINRDSANANSVDTMPSPISPASVAFENSLRIALAQASENASSLADATVAVNNLGTQYPHDGAFDPTSELQVTYEPNAGDAWDAQDLSIMGIDIDWEKLIDFSENGAR